MSLFHYFVDLCYSEIFACTLLEKQKKQTQRQPAYLLSILSSSHTACTLDLRKLSTTSVSHTVHVELPRAGFKGGGVGPPTKPFIFYFSLMINVYETMT